jgi:chromosome partitioning protein
VTIAVINQKGGVGKSSTVATLARLLSSKRPIVVDLDPQRAIGGFKLPRATVDTVISGLPDAKRPGLIDCPPSLEGARAALEAATHAIVPVSCRAQALFATIPFVTALRELWPALPVRMLFTMYSPWDLTSREALGELKAAYDGDAFATVIRSSQLIDRAASWGKTVIDFEPESLPARQYARLLEEIQLWQSQ